MFYVLIHIAHKYSIVLYPKDYDIIDISIKYTCVSNVNLHDRNTYTYKITKANHSERTKILGKIGVNPKDKTDCHFIRLGGD